MRIPATVVAVTACVAAVGMGVAAYLSPDPVRAPLTPPLSPSAVLWKVPIR